MNKVTIFCRKLSSADLMWKKMPQVNESEIPLLHEFNGVAKENCTSIEVNMFSDVKSLVHTACISSLLPFTELSVLVRTQLLYFFPRLVSY